MLAHLAVLPAKRKILIHINNTNPILDEDSPEHAQILAQGGLVAFPTETVYGLGGDARNSQAVAGIYEAKGRPRFNPLIVHVADLAMAETFAVFDARMRKYLSGVSVFLSIVLDTAGSLFAGYLGEIPLFGGEEESSKGFVIVHVIVSKIACTVCGCSVESVLCDG